ncbi:MAG: DNA repair protein RadA, partial [Caldimonas sp.]
MAREKSIYVCTECGGTSAKWLGKCPQCEAWNTLVESVADSTAKPRYAQPTRGLVAGEAVMTLAEIDATDAERQPTGIEEFDRTLGGGIV